MNLPGVGGGTNREKAKASFLRVVLCELPPEGVPRFRVVLHTSDNPIKKILHRSFQLHDFH